MILIVQFKPCPFFVFLGRDSRFYRFCNLLQRYKEFLKPPNIFAIIFQKNAFFFIFGKFLTELAINQPQNACKDIFLTLAQRMAISQGESRNISPFYQ